MHLQNSWKSYTQIIDQPGPAETGRGKDSQLFVVVGRLLEIKGPPDTEIIGFKARRFQISQRISFNLVAFLSASNTVGRFFQLSIQAWGAASLFGI